MADEHEDRLDTRLFIRAFDDPSQISTRLKAFLAATVADPNELMTLVDGIMEGEFHMLGSLAGRSIRCKVGFRGQDIDIMEFSRTDKPKRRRGFFDD